MIKKNKKKLIIFTVVVIFASILVLKNYAINMTLHPVLVEPVKKKTYMSSQTSPSTGITPASSAKVECSNSTDQTVVQWKYMYWFPCKLAWKGICLWPLRRRHTTYKVTVNEGIPLLDESARAIPVARGKMRDWTVYNAEAWNAIENSPREKNRYVDYEQIASNEYVVIVETRYRLFNNVESTLRICVQPSIQSPMKQ
jgi:hypothetical protein